MREEEKRYEAAYDTDAPLYVTGMPAENLLDKIQSWNDVDRLTAQQETQALPEDLAMPMPEYYTSRGQRPSSSGRLPSQRGLEGDSVPPENLAIPMPEYYTSRGQYPSSSGKLPSQRGLEGDSVPPENLAIPMPEYYTSREQRPALSGRLQSRRRFDGILDPDFYGPDDSISQENPQDLIVNLGDNATPTPLPTDNVPVANPPVVPLKPQTGKGRRGEEIALPPLSAEELRQNLRPLPPLMSYLRKNIPEEDVAPATLQPDNLQVAQQPVLPPEAAAKEPHVGLGMDRATSAIDGLRVALERAKLSWNYIEAQARSVINGEKRQGKEYERALQRVIESDIDSDKDLRRQMNMLAKSPRRSDKDDAWALISVKNLRDEGIEWDEMLDVLRERARVPGEATRDIENISRQYAELPPTEGMATVTDIGANIVGAALPVALAVAFAPEAAAAAGTGVVVTDIVSTIADAQMTVDAYERRSGKKVSDAQRNMYVTAATATNMLMDILLNSTILGKFLPSKVGDIADLMMVNIMNNPVAQAEFNAMTRQVLQREAREYAKNATSAAVSGAMTSGALEAEKSIYTGEFPELQNVVNSTLSGFVMGGVAGSALAGAQAYDTHRMRYETDKLYYGSRTEGPYKGRFPMGEMRNIHYRLGEKVQGDVYSPSRGMEYRIVPIGNVVTGSYREAVTGKSLAELMHDNYKIPKKRLNDYRERWEKLRKSNTHEAAVEQNEILQEVASFMGVPIRVYEHYDDLPQWVKEDDESVNAVGLTVGKRDIYLVLPMCNYLSFDGVLNTIRHELVGHRGLHRLYETKEEYISELDRVGAVVAKEQNQAKREIDPSWVYVDYDFSAKARNGAEESFSRTAEKRRYDKGGHKGSEAMKDPILRRSDRNMRNATVNEQRAGIQKDHGFPMPMILELETERNRKNKSNQ